MWLKRGYSNKYSNFYFWRNVLQRCCDNFILFWFLYVTNLDVQTGPNISIVADLTSVHVKPAELVVEVGSDATFTCEVTCHSVVLQCEVQIYIKNSKI